MAQKKAYLLVHMIIRGLKSSRALLIFIVLANAGPVYGAEDPRYIEESFTVMLEGVQANVTTTATMNSQPPGRYSARNLFDADLSSAWATRFTDPEAERAFPDGGLLRIVFAEPVHIASLEIRNGYQKSEALYHANQRIKELRIEKVLMGGRSYPLDHTVVMEDTPAAREISLREGWTPSVNMFKVKELVLDVVDIYEGGKYDDLCISELHLNVTHTADHAPSASWDDVKTLIDANKTVAGSGWRWTGLNENDYRLFSDLLYYTLTGNEEAYRYFESYAPEGAADSAAMNNLYRPAVAGELQVPGH